MKRRPIRKRRTKPRPGRLKGAALARLRQQCWDRDGGECRECLKHTNYLLYKEHPDSYHMAHIKAKRIGGDSLNNVRTLCGDCHRKEHNYGPSMTKPVPSKAGEQ